MPTDTRHAHEAALEVAARHLELGFPGYHGAINFNLFDGHVSGMNLTQSIQRENKRREKSQENAKHG